MSTSSLCIVATRLRRAFRVTASDNSDTSSSELLTMIAMVQISAAAVGRCCPREKASITEAHPGCKHQLSSVAKSWPVLVAKRKFRIRCRRLGVHLADQARKPILTYAWTSSRKRDAEECDMHDTQNKVLAWEPDVSKVGDRSRRSGYNTP